jgi:hypothetical protein
LQAAVGKHRSRQFFFSVRIFPRGWLTNRMDAARDSVW